MRDDDHSICTEGGSIDHPINLHESPLPQPSQHPVPITLAPAERRRPPLHQDRARVLRQAARLHLPAVLHLRRQRQAARAELHRVGECAEGHA